MSLACSGKPSGITKVAVIGIIVGGIAVALLVFIPLVVLFCKRRRQSRRYDTVVRAECATPWIHVVVVEGSVPRPCLAVCVLAESAVVALLPATRLVRVRCLYLVALRPLWSHDRSCHCLRVTQLLTPAEKRAASRSRLV